MYPVPKWKFRTACILLKSGTGIYRQKKKRKMDVVYIDTCRYENQEQKEVSVWYTGI
jgi:hypothetical protein